MYKIKKIYFLAPILITLLFGCKKDAIITPPPVHIEQTAVKFNFTAYFNNEQLIYNRSKLYTNESGDSLNVTKFNYYLSNFKFKKTDGSYYAEPESYHIIKHDEVSTTSFIINNIPIGSYDQIEFYIGVDSTRNVSGAQTGALDVTNAMFWDWNSGYVFFKIEGLYKTSSQLTLDGYAMHVGGYSFPFNNIQKCTFTLNSNNLKIEDGKTPAVFYNVSMDEIFKNPNSLSLDIFHIVAGNKSGATIANNYKDIFTVDKIEN